MSKFTEIVDRPWINLTLLAESIPHLLHWDLAYLWILEKHRAERPDKWKERVEAWKYLVAQLLMDRLIIEKVEIDPPLIQYTKPFWLETVSWLRIKGIKEAVGVLSPVVLVRPLPDYKRTFLESWQTVLPDPGVSDSTKHDLKHLLASAVENLKGQPENSFAARLGNCIKAEFSPQPTGVPSNTRPVQYPFLERLGWSYRQDVPNIRNVPIFVRSEGAEANLWIPRCENQDCRELLTRSEIEDAIDVTSDVITLTCAKCARQNQFALTDFLVWFREGQQVIVWRRDGITSYPPKGLPPVPKSSGNELEFQWNPGPLRGELTKRFLKLRFQGRTVVEKSISEICYAKIIVPGMLTSDYKGLPFRNDWFAAIAKLEVVKSEVDTHLGQITYRNVKINGLPVEVDIRFGSVTIEADSAIHIGLYPNPQQMPPGWKTYRAFVAGTNRNKYIIKGQDYRSILPWLAHFDSGAPNAFSAETQDGRNGVTFINAIPSIPSQAGVQQQVNVGIDFGTSNTLVYVAPLDSDQTNINHEEFAVRPSQLSENILWFSEAEKVSDTPIADFLPSPTRGQSSSDPYLIPTAIWVGNNGVLLRWNAKPPTTGMKENGDFKSNDPGTPPLRLAYLSELMFLTMPQIIRKGTTGNWAVKLNLGFAFPLAFGFDARAQMRDILHKLKTGLETSGCDVDCFTISESRACVRAFGSPRPNEHFLVADMGGGTLDLALFTTRRRDEDPILHQIGSLRYAGEQYVKALANHGQENVWKIRDSISSGESWRTYGGNPAAAKILNRFLGFAFEYLRTIVLAFRQTHEGAKISLVLVGNGWHLADAFSAGRKQQGSRAVFEGIYKHLVTQLRIPDLELYLENPLTELRSSKHLVVIGALQNSWDGQGRRELNSEETEPPKLPSGRGMQLGSDNANNKRFEWHDLVGEGIRLDAYSPGELEADSAFFLDEMPPLVDPWRKYLLEQFNCESIKEIPYPTQAQIRSQIEASIQGLPPRVGKGPLQIILEQSWVKRLNQ